VDLRDRVEGDVRFDEYSRQLYATDASRYEVLPIGVVSPHSTEPGPGPPEMESGDAEWPLLPVPIGRLRTDAGC
jgi:hypothetical protein